MSESKQWRSILYANEKNFFKLQSRADANKFFITDDGKTDLLGELKASVQAIQSETKILNDQSFSCRFPARAAYIRKNILNINTFDDSSCVKLSAWREKVSAESITLVFSSYYLGNPSSTFGHTLLRLNNSGKNKSIRRELLSYGINYGANAWTTNPLVYTIYGLIGMFPGQFVALPYYYKVREYNDFESRDLWEYDLNLTPEEVSRTVDLLWEQGDNFNDYYFLTENCGYYIAALIEAAAPRFEIVTPLRKWVIPSDTIVQFQKSGVIKSRKWRPSIYNQFLGRLSILNSDQEQTVREVFEMAENKKTEWPKDFEKLNLDEQAKVLDAALDYYDLRHNKELANDNSPENKIKSQLLIRRSQLPTGLPLPEKDIETLAPENAHGSFRWQFSAFNSESKSNPSASASSAVLGARFSFHDLEDPLPGYPEGAHIEMFNFKVRIPANTNESEKIKLQEIKIFEMGTYPDNNSWTDKKSFDVYAGLFRLQNNICSDCLVSELNIAYGLSKTVSDFRFSFLGQVKYMHGDFNSNHNNGWNYFGWGPRLIMQYDYSSDYQTRLAAAYQSLSTAENKLWSADLIFRRNIRNEYAVELGASTNEIQNIYNVSVYYFTF